MSRQRMQDYRIPTPVFKHLTRDLDEVLRNACPRGRSKACLPDQVMNPVSEFMKNSFDVALTKESRFRGCWDGEGGEEHCGGIVLRAVWLLAPLSVFSSPAWKCRLRVAHVGDAYFAWMVFLPIAR